jgi:hypothetical protein
MCFALKNFTLQLKFSPQKFKILRMTRLLKLVVIIITCGLPSDRSLAATLCRQTGPWQPLSSSLPSGLYFSKRSEAFQKLIHYSHSLFNMRVFFPILLPSAHPLTFHLCTIFSWRFVFSEAESFLCSLLRSTFTISIDAVGQFSVSSPTGDTSVQS